MPINFRPERELSRTESHSQARSMGAEVSGHAMHGYASSDLRDACWSQPVDIFWERNGPLQCFPSLPAARRARRLMRPRKGNSSRTVSPSLPARHFTLIISPLARKTEAMRVGSPSTAPSLRLPSSPWLRRLSSPRLCDGRHALGLLGELAMSLCLTMPHVCRGCLGGEQPLGKVAMAGSGGFKRRPALLCSSCHGASGGANCDSRRTQASCRRRGVIGFEAPSGTDGRCIETQASRPLRASNGTFCRRGGESFWSVWPVFSLPHPSNAGASPTPLSLRLFTYKACIAQSHVSPLHPQSPSQSSILSSFALVPPTVYRL